MNNETLSMLASVRLKRVTSFIKTISKQVNKVLVLHLIWPLIEVNILSVEIKRIDLDTKLKK